MTRREQRLTQFVKKHDPNLFVKMGDDSRMYLIRNSRKWASFEYGGVTYRYSRLDPQVIFALTDDWSPQGRPVDCGIERLWNRLNEIDSHRSNEILDRINTAMELRHEAKEKDFANKVEAFAYDARTAVKNDFKDYNLSTVDKRDIRYKHDEIAKRKGL